MTDSYKDWAFKNLKGIWIVPQVTFKSADGYALDDDAMQTNFERCLSLDANGVGYTMLMEPWASTHEERIRGAQLMTDTVRGRAHTYANITDHSVAETIRLGERSLEAGVDLLLLNCPYEWAKSEELAIDFLVHVANHLEGKILLYNTAHSGLILSPEAISRIADCDNVVGIKNATNDLNHSVRLNKLAGDKMVVSEAFETNLLGAIREYRQQVFLASTAAHLLQTPIYQPIAEYMKLALAGHMDEAASVRARLEPLRRLWLSVYQGVTDLNHATHPLAITKYWQCLMGFAGEDVVRPPMPQATEDEKAAVRAGLVPFAADYGLDLG